MTSRLRRAPGVTFEPTSGGAAAAPAAVLINPESRVYYTLDARGAEFWQLMDGERTLEAIVAALAATRGDHVEALEAELAELARALLQEGFLEVA